MVYLLFYFKNVLAPPHLKVDCPQENQVVDNFLLNVSGETEPETEVKINDQLTIIDSEGKFSENIYLKSGVNTIAITAKKKHSRKSSVIRQVLVEASNY